MKQKREMEVSDKHLKELDHIDMHKLKLVNDALQVASATKIYFFVGKIQQYTFFGGRDFLLVLRAARCITHPASCPT